MKLPPSGVMSLSAASELRGGRRLIRDGRSCGPNQAFAPTGTTCFSITTPRAATSRWMRTSALKSHARLNPLGKFTPPRLRRAWLRLQCMWAYDRIKETHDAIHPWCEVSNWAFAGKSWEIYGRWSEDPSKLETTIMYMLK